MSITFRRRISAIEAKLPAAAQSVLPDILDAPFCAYLYAEGYTDGEIDDLFSRLIKDAGLLPSPRAFRNMSTHELDLLERYLGQS